MATDLQKATAVATWLQGNGCTVTLFAKTEHVEVVYTLQHDVKPQPPIIVKNGNIRIPEGSQEAVLTAFLNFLIRGK